MGRPLSAAIAWRYLISKKSYAAVGTISTVSVCAMAVATAAIICVLSVFNGFRQIIGEKLDSLAPDIMVSPAAGKVFDNADALAARISSIKGVSTATPTLSDKALVICNGKETPVTLKGVRPDAYSQVTAIKTLIPEEYGSYMSPQVNPASSSPEDEESPVEAILSVGIASRLQAYPGQGAILFAPRREGRVNLANPAASFLTDSITVRGVYRSDQSQYDEDGMIIPLEAARKLFMYDTQASAIEAKLTPETSPEATRDQIAKAIGSGYVVKDRLQQQEMNFRMISIEKWVSFLLLSFILLIAGFNIISSLSMLVIEKEEAISTFKALGMSRRRIGRIFAWESIYVSLAGGIAGILLGVSLCLVQQHFGLIRIAGDADMSIIQAYPVALNTFDILATALISMGLAAVSAFITAAFARSKA